MKRGVITILILLLVFNIFSLVSGENDSIKNTSDFKEKTEEKIKEDFSFLKNDVKIPDWLGNSADFIFQFEEDIGLSVLVILIAIFAMLFLVIQNIMKIMPFFDGWKSWFASLFVTLLISISGAINSVTRFFFEIANFMGVLEKYGFLKIIFLIVLILIVIFTVKYVSDLVKEKLGEENAEMSGIKAGTGKKILESTAESFKGK